jgi:peptide deformylase
MQQPIMTSEVFLSKPSKPALPRDVGIAVDLKDTLAAYAGECVGMAANMIGVSKRIIAFNDDVTGRITTMFNPRIVDCGEPFETVEGCLSVAGEHMTTRYKTIVVTYQNAKFKERTARFSGWTAQIIQHEIDHCDGVLI